MQLTCMATQCDIHLHWWQDYKQRSWGGILSYWIYGGKCSQSHCSV